MSDEPPRSRGSPENAPDPDMLAAEYVLGLLPPGQRRVVAAAAERDPAMAEAVGGWSARLEPLASLAAPVAPSEGLWARIARDLPRPARPVAPVAPPGRFVWRGIALGGYGLAAGLAAALLLARHRLDIRIAWDMPAPVIPTAGRPPAQPVRPAVVPQPVPPLSEAPRPPRPAPVAPPPVVVHAEQAVALLTAAGGERPAMKAYFVQGGTVRLVAMQPVRVAPDKQLGFWVWPRGTALPIPLGRVDADGGTLRFPYREADGTPVMVTLEPRQTPVSDAQGPTLFTGQLVAVD